MHTEKMSWGGLTAYVVHDLDDLQQPDLAIVLCHGYGAPGTDLVALARPLVSTTRADAKLVFVFPAAPLDLTAKGLPGGRAWWPIDLDRLLNRPTPELLTEFRQACPPGLPQARQRLLSLLSEAGKRLGLPADRFVLGGFSQGAMLATDIALRLKRPPAGLCILSGGLINEHEWRALAAERGRLAVLQSHGTFDSILPFPMAEALRDLLVAGGAQVEFIRFPGDHEIPPDVIESAAAWLAKVAKATG